MYQELSLPTGILVMFCSINSRDKVCCSYVFISSVRLLQILKLSSPCCVTVEVMEQSLDKAKDDCQIVRDENDHMRLEISVLKQELTKSIKR